MSAPADFIPVAEESALIVEIGAWTLMQACHESAAAFGVGADGPVGRRQPLAPPARAARPARRWSPTACARAGCPRARLRLEVKETVLLGAPKTARRNLEELRAIGVGLALDDFGTGYSSLRDLPVAAVKIDRSFVGRLGHAARATRRSSPRSSRWRGALGIDAIAEGVEHEAQAALLRELGCPLAQGYLFGAPGDPDNLRPVTTFEELDALSSRELHDRAVKRAEHRLDVKFFWRLIQEGTAADAAEGVARARRGGGRALEPPDARGAAPRRRRARGAPSDLHRLSAGQTLGIARIGPSGGFVFRGRLTALVRVMEIARAWS